MRRLLVTIPLLLAASALSFLLVANSGDPLENLRMNPRTTPEQIASREQELNLDKPVVARYFIWLGGALHGDFGKDNQGGDVATQLWRALSVTLRLVVIAEIIAVLVGVTIGVFSALRQYSLFDYGTTFVAFLFFALPTFWLAVLLKEYVGIKFNELVGSRVLYTVGQESLNPPDGFWARLGDIAGHMVLPVMTLTLIAVAGYSRYQRSTMLDVESSDYVRTATAKGLSRRRVVAKHAFRNALIPVVTLVALDFGALLGGAVITETVFQWRGMGSLLVKSVSQIDVNIMQAWLLVTALMVILFNLIADVVYGVLDPRIRFD
jgi:peptide/nickel transport system permease protein